MSTHSNCISFNKLEISLDWSIPPEIVFQGSVEVRAELDRLQNTVSNLQKSNLCLEAENLELKLDLEKSPKELPHLREQIQHLEK